MISRVNSFIFFISLFFCACNGEDNGNDGVGTVKPSNLSVTANVIGANSENPNGDGSGKVEFKLNASNAAYYKINVDGNNMELTETVFTYTFGKGGTHEYPVAVSAYNSGGFVSTTIAVKVYVDDELELVWQDEFDQEGTPDPNNWGYNIGNGENGWGNNESQYYTDRLENAKVENGVLKITAKREDYEGFGFTSARLLTANKFDFTYGRIDVRAKLAGGGGTWPAIWMLGSSIGMVGWPACGEIDIMEYTGNNPGKVQSALHTSSSFGNTVNHKSVPISNETTEFHTYSIIWTEESIVFLLDDEAYYTYDPTPKNNKNWPFTKEQFIILNIAIGGNLGGEIDPNFQSSTMEIDYVRVYQ